MLVQTCCTLSTPQKAASADLTEATLLNAPCAKGADRKVIVRHSQNELLEEYQLA
jgi:hypothetical protein